MPILVSAKALFDTDLTRARAWMVNTAQVAICADFTVACAVVQRESWQRTGDPN